MFKVNKKTPEQGHCCSGVFIVDFEYISHIVVSFVNFEHANVCWERILFQNQDTRKH